MKFEVEQKLLEVIGSYLVTKPWQEVHLLVDALKACKPIEEPTNIAADAKEEG
jgi:hypothetical protein